MTDLSSSAGGAAESAAPTIEFRCRTCDRLLSVADVAAGQSVKCPQCNGVMRAPSLGDLEDGPVPGTSAASDLAVAVPAVTPATEPPPVAGRTSVLPGGDSTDVAGPPAVASA
ncbi:MAG: hypothetical protein OES79_06110, partial [Planctomycetota bacterium]|nr:hypothetical protein [Planctomycetota bacterium]